MLSKLFRRLVEFLIKIYRRKTKDNPSPTPTPNKKPPVDPKPVHPWRICPLGEYWRNLHPRHVTPSKKHPDGITTVKGHCVTNPSGKDQLYSEEMQLIAEKNFGQFKLIPLPEIPEFQKKDLVYDHIIQGWTQYWNDVLKPQEPLDPCLVKALIATESGFNSNAWNKKHGRQRARGLTQVTDQTLRYLSDDYHELKDHFLHLKEDETLDPNFSICAGIRWLFRKKEIANSKIGRKASWIDAVGEYKHYKMDDPNMQKFIEIYKELKI